jgi:hypothetical protein
MERINCPVIHAEGLPRLPRVKGDNYPKTEQELVQDGYAIIKSGSK